MPSKVIPDLKYTKEHEWARIEGDHATIGITDHAQAQLGDVVYVEVPAPGSEIVQGKTFGVVESVKAVSDLFAPLSGTVVEANDKAVNGPELINSDPYGDAWLIKLKLKNMRELGDLMDAKAYQSYLAEISK
jgi:glycine cleavage system H protein